MSWDGQHSSLGAYFYTYYDLSMLLQWQRQFFHIISPVPQPEAGLNGKYSQNIHISSTQQYQIADKRQPNLVPDLGQKPIRHVKLTKRREREDNFQKKKQKKDRNLPSNILKLFILNLFGHPNIAQGYLRHLHNNNNCNLGILIEKIRQIVKPTQNYIRPATIQKLYSQQYLSKQEELAFRVMIKKFLLEELAMIITPLKKYRRRQTREILKFGRKIFENLNKNYYA